MIPKDINRAIDLVQSAAGIPGRLADAAWEWAARKVMPLDDSQQPWGTWEDEAL